MDTIQNIIMRELRNRSEVKVHKSWAMSLNELIDQDLVKIVRVTEKHFVVSYSERTKAQEV